MDAEEEIPDMPRQWLEHRSRYVQQCDLFGKVGCVGAFVSLFYLVPYTVLLLGYHFEKIDVPYSVMLALTIVLAMLLGGTYWAINRMKRFSFNIGWIDGFSEVNNEKYGAGNWEAEFVEPSRSRR